MRKNYESGFCPLVFFFVFLFSLPSLFNCGVLTLKELKVFFLELGEHECNPGPPPYALDQRQQGCVASFACR